MISFYNSLTRKKQEFLPIEKNLVKIYSCGPTVYNFVHIGNLRAYIFSDILVKSLRYFNFKVINVMNLTDVDDKTIRDSQKNITLNNESPNVILKNFTDKYKKYFLEDLADMNIAKPNIMPSAVNSISDMEFLIEKLFEKGFTYVGDDGIYFDLSKAKNYGKLVNIDFSHQRKNVCNRVINDEYDKDNAADFVLWKFKKEVNEPFWTIKIGGVEYQGRPGWHIECSAMSLAYLGEVFDIHTGGVDLKFPHHENEICQSSCALGIDSQANFWMHNEHLLVDSKKMSKSLGNFYTLRDLKEKGYSALALREVYLRSHYRQQLNFTFDSLDAGETNVKKINDFYNKFKQISYSEKSSFDVDKLYNQELTKFELALKDDLNTPKAIASLYEFMNEVNRHNFFSEKQVEIILDFLKRVDSVFSLIIYNDLDVPKEVLDLLNLRKLARANKDWIKSDELRDRIKKLGFDVKDSNTAKLGYILTKL